MDEFEIIDVDHPDFIRLMNDEGFQRVFQEAVEDLIEQKKTPPPTDSPPYAE